MSSSIVRESNASKRKDVQKKLQKRDTGIDSATELVCKY